jgi:hypothetical protein
MCAYVAMCAANWSRLSRPVPCLGFVWAESTNYVLLAGGQASNPWKRYGAFPDCYALSFIHPAVLKPDCVTEGLEIRPIITQWECKYMLYFKTSYHVHFLAGKGYPNITLQTCAASSISPQLVHFCCIFPDMIQGLIPFSSDHFSQESKLANNN